MGLHSACKYVKLREVGKEVRQSKMLGILLIGRLPSGGVGLAVKSVI